jgi:hypothetical protein
MILRLDKKEVLFNYCCSHLEIFKGLENISFDKVLSFCIEDIENIGVKPFFDNNRSDLILTEQQRSSLKGLETFVVEILNGEETEEKFVVELSKPSSS